jgi:hypothetical protein
VEAQQERSRFKQFFRQAELSTLLKGCRVGLEEALAMFKVCFQRFPFNDSLSVPLQVQSVNILSDVVQMQRLAERTHNEVLELIQALSDDTTSSVGNIVRCFSVADTSCPDQQGLFPKSDQVCANNRGFT